MRKVKFKGGFTPIWFLLYNKAMFHWEGLHCRLGPDKLAQSGHVCTGREATIIDFTLAQAMQVFPLSLGELVAGKNGVNRIVKLVDVLEVNILKVPVSAQFIHGPSLLISSFYAVMDSVPDQVRMIRLLNKQGASGLVLCHLSIVVKELSQELLDVCDELEFPLLVVPPTISYKELISNLSDAIMEKHNKELRRSIEIYDMLTKMLVEEKDSKQLVKTLGEIIGRAILFFNHNGAVVVAPALSEEQKKELTALVRENSEKILRTRADIILTGPNGEETLQLTPVFSSAAYFGVLVILESGGLSEIDKIAIAQARNALSISVMKKINVEEERRLLIFDFINDMVRGNSADYHATLSRGKNLGFNISHLQSVMLLDVQPAICRESRPAEIDMYEAQTLCKEQVELYLKSLSPTSACAGMEGRVILFFMEDVLPDKAQQRMKHLGDTLIAKIQAKLGIPVSVGIGSHCEKLEDIGRSYEAALNCLYISHQFFVTPSCLCSCDYPALVLLLKMFKEMKDSKDVESLFSLLQPLRDYDAQAGGDLEETFRTLLMCDMDTSLVAEKMYLHKNTVLQRKKKIASFYPYDPFLHISRFQFEIAFTLQNLFGIER